MASTNTTSNLHLPQFAETDVPTWEDVNAAFKLIDDFAGSVNEKLAGATGGGLTTDDLKNFVKVDETNGSGITANEYAHLSVNK